MNNSIQNEQCLIHSNCNFSQLLGLLQELHEKTKDTNNEQMAIMNYLGSPMCGRKKQVLKQICVINALPYVLVSLDLLKRMQQIRVLVVRSEIPLYITEPCNHQ